MQEERERAQRNDRLDSENLSNELRVFTEEIDNDVIQLLRCDEILNGELDDDLDENASEEEMMYDMMGEPDFGYCVPNPGFDECLCDAGALWNEASIWSSPHGLLEYNRVQEHANRDAGNVQSSCAVLFWGW